MPLSVPNGRSAVRRNDELHGQRRHRDLRDESQPSHRTSDPFRRGANIRVSTLVYSQLLQGVPKSERPELEIAAIAAFVGAIHLADYDRSAASTYGRLVAAFGFSRRNVVDHMIAAHAISLDATLVTNNVKDFVGLPGLAVTNWTE